MKEPTYIDETQRAIPLSQCSTVQLAEVANGQVQFIPDEADTDEGFGRYYASLLLAERLK